MPDDTNVHPTLHAALAAVQADLPVVTRGEEADTGRYTYKYATLHDCNRALLPLLSVHGLTWACIPHVDEQRMDGVLTHADTGESIVTTWVLPNTNDPQAIGSAITYGRRYLLTALVGLAHPDEDDDGEAAQTAPPPELSDRDRVANLVLEYVPEAHVPFLLDAYQEGAASLDDVDDVNIGRMRRALSSRGSRERVLSGVADRFDAAQDGDDEPPPAGGTPDDEPDGDGADDAQAGAPDAHDRTDGDGSSSQQEGTSVTDEPTATEIYGGGTDEPADEDHPAAMTRVELLEHYYDELTVAEVDHLLRHGDVTHERVDGEGTVTLELPRQAPGGILHALELVEALEQARPGDDRKTVKGSLENAGWTPKGKASLRDARARAAMDDPDPRHAAEQDQDGPPAAAEEDAADDGATTPEDAPGPETATESVDPDALDDNMATRRRMLARWKRGYRELGELHPGRARRIEVQRLNMHLGEDDQWLAAPMGEIGKLVADTERMLAAARQET